MTDEEFEQLLQQIQAREVADIASRFPPKDGLADVYARARRTQPGGER